MIKLKELLDINYPSVDLFSGSPVRVGKWDTNQLESLSGNYTFTVGVKEKAKSIGIFDKYEIYEYQTKDTTINCFVNGDYTVCFFQYKIVDGYCDIKLLWQETTHIGLSRKIILEYYLKKYDGIITDNLHTEFGERCIKKLLEVALNLGYKIFVLKDGKEKIYVTDLSSLEQYYSSGTLGLKYQFGIENNNE